MKKNLFGWLAMATMLVGTGCSSDEVVNDYSPENAIQFGTYVGRDANGRAQVLTKDGTDGTKSLQTTGFGVFAYLHSGTVDYERANFMNNVVVSGSPWGYANAKYWPNDVSNKLDFLAYGPYADTNITGVTDGDKSLSFAVPNDVSKQSDLVVALPLKNMTKNSASLVNSKVTFNFKHMLSRIAFSAKKAEDYANVSSIVVNSITLAGNFAPSGTVDMSDDTPVITGTPSAQTYTLTNNTNFVTSGISTAFAELNQNKANYMMLIPTTTNLTITVDYTVNYADGSASVTNNISQGVSEFPFGAGQAYMFNLTISLNKIEFDAEVTDWFSPVVEYTVPNNF